MEQQLLFEECTVNEEGKVITKGSVNGDLFIWEPSFSTRIVKDVMGDERDSLMLMQQATLFGGFCEYMAIEKNVCVAADRRMTAEAMALFSKKVMEIWGTN